MGTELAHYCYAHPAGGEREGEAVENSSPMKCAILAERWFHGSNC